MSRITICIPTHSMRNGQYFLNRLYSSLEKQTFKDFDIVETKEGRMAENTNAAIKKAKGDIVKILFMDDYLWSRDALQHISDNFISGWYASGCVHTEDGITFSNPHKPVYSEDIWTGNNTIGSPSVVAFENDNPLLFDENLSWLLDCDLYARLYERYGAPTCVPYLDVAMGIGSHQVTNTMADTEKRKEFYYLKKKYG